MGVSVDRPFSDLCDQGVETGVPVDPRADDHDVNEEPDEILNFRDPAVRHWYTDGNIILTGIFMEQYLKRRQENHEEGRGFAPSQCPGVFFDLLGNKELNRRAVEALSQRPGFIDRQLNCLAAPFERTLP